jgi:DNA repair protein RadC
MKTTQTIHDLPRVERPREKLLQYGPEKLSHAELLAILLRTGRKGHNVISLAKNILRKFPNNSLVSADVDTLKNIFGLGPTKACEIIACFELGKRFLQQKKADLYLNAEDVWKTLNDIRCKKKESFVILYLDTRSQEIKRDIISIGTLTTAVIHPREVFEPAIRHTASQVIIAHNHPSGDPEPSRSDIDLTNRLVLAAEILGIELLDHVIVTKDSYTSFREQGLLPPFIDSEATIIVEN